MNNNSVKQHDSSKDRGVKGPRRRNVKKREPQRETWTPCTKLGRYVKDELITDIAEIYKYCIKIKEHQIIDKLFSVNNESSLIDEVVKISPVQKQTTAGQRTLFKAVVLIGDRKTHLGIGVKAAKEVALAIKGAIIIAKLSLIPVRQGYWGNAIGLPHTVFCTSSGKCASVLIKVVPAPRGTGIVGAPIIKSTLTAAGVKDAFTQSSGSTATVANFLRATYFALRNTYSFNSPDLWISKKAPRTIFDVMDEQVIN